MEVLTWCLNLCTVEFLLHRPQCNLAGSLVLILVYYALIGLLLDFVFQIKARGWEHTMLGSIPSPHQRFFTAGAFERHTAPVYRCQPLNSVTSSVPGENCKTLTKSKMILPLPVCVCWTESRESSLFPCPYGRCLPTGPCSWDLPDCTF